MSGTGVPFDTKLRFFAKQIAWIVVMVLLLPICLWGTFLGWQYRDDECVLSNKYYTALAWWLMAVCVYNFVSAAIIMLLLCCHITAKFRRVIIWSLHAINILSSVLGMWLILNAELNGTTCKHNELWIFSVVIVCLIMSIAIILGSTRVCMGFGLCVRFGRFVAIEDNPYQFSYQEVETGPPLETFAGADGPMHLHSTDDGF